MNRPINRHHLIHTSLQTLHEAERRWRDVSKLRNEIGSVRYSTDIWTILNLSEQVDELLKNTKESPFYWIQWELYNEVK